MKVALLFKLKLITTPTRMNTLITQLKQRREVIAPYESFKLEDASQRLERQFAFASTNLYNLLPELRQRKYLDVFKQLHINRRLSFLDVEQAAMPGLLEITGWDEQWASSLRRQPGIVCTYHTGSYRLINYLLARAEVPISLVVSSEALRAEQQAMSNLYAAVGSQFGRHLNIELIDAEQPYAIISMTRAIKQGRSLVVYIDGNTGAANGQKDRHNLLETDFCGKPMAARQGMAMVAHRLQIPIYPVICQRCTAHDDGLRLNNMIDYTVQTPITPFNNEDSQEFVARATRSLYGLLASFVAEKPAQWDGWLYLHHQLILDSKPVEPDEYNAEHWAPFRIGSRAYLLHRPDYLCYRVHWAHYRNWWWWYNESFISNYQKT